MSRVWRNAWIIFGLNIAVFFLCMVGTQLFADNLTVGLTLLFLVPGLLIILQLILGVIFAVGNKREAIGKGMLIAVGLILLIGLSFCSIVSIVDI
jgi:hypothetical protein